VAASIMIVKTEAIVLSSMKYRDTSKILRLYTREFGKVSVIAKGARDTKSKFRSALEPMSYVSAVIYRNENRELQLLSQCDLITAFRHLSEDMEKMYVVMSAIELVDIVSHDEEQNETLFLLLRNLIETVNNATKSTIVALYYFETKLSELLGFRPDLSLCTLCNKTIEKDFSQSTTFSLVHDGVLCKDCSERSGMNMISSAALRILQRLQKLETMESVLNLHLSPSLQDEVRVALRGHLQKHIEGFRGLRSEEVFAAIL
jgi:DNA repair protein RecO (recombination protein O)